MLVHPVQDLDALRGGLDAPGLQQGLGLAAGRKLRVHGFNVDQV